MLLFRQYAEQYCHNIVHHIVNFHNIGTIYDNNIVAQYCENCQNCDNIVEHSHSIIYIIYDNNIVKIDNMVNNIVTILFAILSDLTTLLTILLQYCCFVTILGTILIVSIHGEGR